MSTKPEKTFLKLVLLSELFSSSESSSDEEAAWAVCGVKKARVVDFIEVVNAYTDEQFRENFRMTRVTCYNLIEHFTQSDYFPKRHNGGKPPISATKHILAFLWFAGNKAIIREVTQLFNISESTFEVICERVMNYLHSIGPEVIKFPKRQEELETLAASFEEVSGFPNVMGCIDGTYISIRTPAHKIRSTYANRHHQTSLTLQGICDNQKKFIDVFTGVPGKMHDSRVFRESFISREIPLIYRNTYHLLGDSAYPLSPFLITPYRDYGNLTQAQRRFNRRFSETRVLIENCFGLLKGRFRQLLHLDFHKVVKSSKFIISCCILHNLCITNNDFWEEQLIEEREPEYLIQRRDELLRLGEMKRDMICNLFI